MHNLPFMRRVRNLQRHERPQEETFPGGARLRGYVRPKSERIKETCVCCGVQTSQNSDIDKSIGQLAEKYGLIAYTIELHFSHSAPLILRYRASTSATKYNIVTDILNTLEESQIQMIEEIQLEYLSGDTYEFSKEEIDDLRLLTTAFKKGGYMAQKNDYISIPAMRREQMF